MSDFQKEKIIMATIGILILSITIFASWGMIKHVPVNRKLKIYHSGRIEVVD